MSSLDTITGRTLLKCTPHNIYRIVHQVWPIYTCKSYTPIKCTKVLINQTQPCCLLSVWTKWLNRLRKTWSKAKRFRHVQFALKLIRLQETCHVCTHFATIVWPRTLFPRARSNRIRWDFHVRFADVLYPRQHLLQR